VTSALNGLAALLAGLCLGFVLPGLGPTLVRRSRGAALEVVIVGSAGVCALLRTAPTGNLVADLILSAGLGALGSWGAARAPHMPVAVLTILIAVTSGLAPPAGLGAGMAVAVVVMRSRLPLLKALAGGAAAAGALTSIGPDGGTLTHLAALALVLLFPVLAARRASGPVRRSVSVGAAVLLGYLVIAAGAFGITAFPAAGDLARGTRLAQRGAETIAEGAPNPSLAIAATAFASAHDRLDSAPARLLDFVPGAAQNAAALRSLALAGQTVSEAAAQAVGGPADLALADGRVDLSAIDVAAGSVGRTRRAIGAAMEQLDSARSPSLLPPVEEGVEDLRSELARAWPVLEDLGAGLEVLPGILGRGTPRQYLLVLQTPSELRASGGIIGGFAVLRAEAGRLSLERTGKVDDLNLAGDPSSRSVQGQEEFLDRYGRFQPLQIWQNVTLSPDWPTVGAVAAQLAPQSGVGEVDGVIGLDPYALRAILGAIGPVEVAPWPVALSADNVVPVLMHEQYLFFENPERREFLADVTAATFDKLVAGGASLKPLASALAGAARSEHALLWLENQAEQAVAQRIDAAGEVTRPPEGDSVMVVNQNSSGNKIDWFLRRSTDYRVRFDPALGRAEALLTVKLRNEAPKSGLPPYVIGSSSPGASRTAPGENRTLFSVYSPLSLSAARVNGGPLELTAAEELGRNVYSGFLTIPPGGELTIELELDGPVDPVDNRYVVELHRQVLPEPEPFSVEVTYPDGWQPAGPSDAKLALEADRRLRFDYRRDG
jgi:hypothetical protein